MAASATDPPRPKRQLTLPRLYANLSAMAPQRPSAESAADENVKSHDLSERIVSTLRAQPLNQFVRLVLEKPVQSVVAGDVVQCGQFSLVP